MTIIYQEVYWKYRLSFFMSHVVNSVKYHYIIIRIVLLEYYVIFILFYHQFQKKKKKTIRTFVRNMRKKFYFHFKMLKLSIVLQTHRFSPETFSKSRKFKFPQKQQSHLHISTAEKSVQLFLLLIYYIDKLHGPLAPESAFFAYATFARLSASSLTSRIAGWVRDYHVLSIRSQVGPWARSNAGRNLRKKSEWQMQSRLHHVYCVHWRPSVSFSFSALTRVLMLAIISVPPRGVPIATASTFITPSAITSQYAAAMCILHGDMHLECLKIRVKARNILWVFGAPSGKNLIHLTVPEVSK